jgi:hypothetical protein
MIKWTETIDGREYQIMLVGDEANAWAKALEHAEYEGLSWISHDGFVIGCESGLAYLFPPDHELCIPEWAKSADLLEARDAQPA